MFQFEPYSSINFMDYYHVRFQKLSDVSPYKQILRTPHFEVGIDTSTFVTNLSCHYSLVETKEGMIETLFLKTDEIIELHTSFRNEDEKQRFVSSILTCFHVVYHGKLPTPKPNMHHFCSAVSDRIGKTPDFIFNGDILLMHQPTETEFRIYTENLQDYFVCSKPGETSPEVISRIHNVFNCFRLENLFR